MSNQQAPTVIVNQSQKQVNNGCCSGAGCGTIFLIALIITGAVYLWEAMMGVHGAWWAIGAWTGTVIVALLLIAGGFAWADKAFGWGLLDENTPTGYENTKTAEEILDEQNYGHPKNAGMFDTTSRPSSNKMTTGASAKPTMGDSEAPVYDRIRELGRLRDEGLITAEEFDAKKRELLKRM